MEAGVVVEISEGGGVVQRQVAFDSGDSGDVVALGVGVGVGVGEQLRVVGAEVDVECT